MSRLLLLSCCALLVAGCAKARETGKNLDPTPGEDGGIVDLPHKPVKKDQGVTPPQKDQGRLDGPVHDTKPWPKDLPPPTPDKTPPPPKPCPDPYEVNNNCSGGRSLGIVNEGATWILKTPTLSPKGDVDWFYGEGHEISHSCIPLTGQTYYFRMRVLVPPGRSVKACVVQGACSGQDSCQSKTGPAQINVSYKVKGTCAINDNTKAWMLVQALDSKHDCVPYAISYGYGK